ncbi:MAG: hypothetical protein Q7S88_01240 [Candidatus Daviesbacteria bacterium]|nr:hypothetical protein [Candidatus Daviesbacteria bacterium]
MSAQRGSPQFDVFSREAGFAPIAIVAIVGVLLAGGAGLFYLQRSTPSNSTSLKTQSETQTKDSSQISFEASDKKLLLTGGFADPSVIKLNDKYIMYVNKFGGGPSANLVYTSSDGIAWTDTGKKVPGAPTSRVFLMDGLVRLYYTTQVPINPSDPPSQILSAKSTDGINFINEEGIRVKPTDGYVIEGPSLIKTDSGYRLYFSEFKKEKPQERRDGKIFGADSKDGLTWARDAKPSIETTEVENASADWPQAIRPYVLKRPTGGFVLFYNTHSKIYAALSDNGISWEKLGSIGIKGADSDGYYQPDGTIRFYYGDFSEKTSGVVYTAVLTETKGKKADAPDKQPMENIKPFGTKPPPPPECVGKKADDPNLSQSCQMWFKIQ